MKYVICFLIYFSNFNCYSQITIELKMPVNSMGNFIFNKPSDSIYIKLGHREDMGSRYGFYFEFKKNIPDGEYQVFLNDRISRKGYIKNSNKEGNWYEYGISGELFVIYKYKNGKLNGKSIWNYRNNKIKQISNYKNGKAIWTKSFNDQGKMISKTYYYE